MKVSPILVQFFAAVALATDAFGNEIFEEEEERRDLSLVRTISKKENDCWLAGCVDS